MAKQSQPSIASQQAITTTNLLPDDALRTFTASVQAFTKAGIGVVASVVAVYLIGHHLQEGDKRASIKSLEAHMQSAIDKAHALKSGMVGMYLSLGHKVFTSLVTGTKFGGIVADVAKAKDTNSAATIILEWLGKNGIANLDTLRSRYGMATGREVTAARKIVTDLKAKGVVVTKDVLKAEAKKEGINLSEKKVEQVLTPPNPATGVIRALETAEKAVKEGTISEKTLAQEIAPKVSSPATFVLEFCKRIPTDDFLDLLVRLNTLADARAKADSVADGPAKTPKAPVATVVASTVRAKVAAKRDRTKAKPGR